MLLNNYYNLVSFFSNNLNDLSGMATTFVGAYNKSGVQITDVTYKSTTTLSYGQAVSKNANPRLELSFAVGTGTTSPTYTDCDMTNDVTSDFTGTSMSLSVYDTDSIITVIELHGTNNTASDISISEIGIFKNLYCGNNTATRVNTMIMHYKLPTAKVISPGDDINLLLKWENTQEVV